MPELPSRFRVFSHAVQLRCPRCGIGPLFRGWFRMHDACPHCGFSYEREPGFYLGSIYLNYGATVILTGALYAVLMMGLGLSNETTLAVCLAAAVLCPIFFFRHARSFLLALDSSVNKNQAHSPQETDADPASTLSTRKLASLASDDGRAGCAMGVALALILLFGLGMAAVTLFFTVGSMQTEPAEGLD